MEWIFKPRMILETGLIGALTNTTDISDDYAIVDDAFVKNVCRDMCRIRACQEQYFDDRGRIDFVVCDQCPYYAEAVLNDVRYIEKP